MPGLLDSINKQLQTPSPTPALGATEQVGGLLRAKLGKATQPSGSPAQSNIQEQVAQQTAQQGLRQIGEQSQLAGLQMGEQAADQAQAAKQQEEAHQEKLTDLQANYSRQANNIIQDLESNQAIMSANQKMAKMEQAGFMIRGANDNYVKELQRQGQMNRLANNNNFRLEMAKAVMGEDQELFDSDLKFQKMMDANARDFQVALANMSDEFAMKMGENAAKTASTQSMFSGLSGIMSGGLQAYDTASRKSDNGEEAE